MGRRRSRRARASILLAAALALGAAGPLCAQWGAFEVPRPLPPDSLGIELGRRVYEGHCWYCHGEEGRGDGPVADYLWPRPRSFYDATYRLRSTESGYLPRDEDLFRSISLGIPGTAMPEWKSVLTPEERWSVIAYVKRFAADLFESPFMHPDSAAVEVGRPPDVRTDSLVAWGRRVYRDSECGSCHGASGRGHGSRADSLEDDAGHRMRPADLGLGWAYKGGKSVEDVFLRLTTGMDGTPMPSYRETLAEDERWAVAHFVRSLQEQLGGEASERGVVLRAVPVEGRLPREPSAPEWERAPVLRLPMTGQATHRPRWQTPAVRDLWVRALYDTGSVVLHLTWHDPFPDTVPVSILEEREAGWAEGGDTYPVLGEEGPGAAERFTDILEVLYPAERARGAALPHFVFGDADRPVEVVRWSAAGREAAGARSDRVLRLRANGAEQPPTELAGSGRTWARGVWHEGAWSLVIEMPGPEPILEPGDHLPVTFHVREGRNGEVGLKMSVASWHFLYLEERAGAGDYLSVAAAVVLTGLFGLFLVGTARRKRRRGDLRSYGLDAN